MTKEKISKLEFISKIDNLIYEKSLKVGFVFTMKDRSERKWYLHTRDLKNCTDVSFKDCTSKSLEEWHNFKESFRKEAESIILSKYTIQTFDKYGMPI